MRVALTGPNGRMGQEIRKFLKKSKKHKYVAGRGRVAQRSQKIYDNLQEMPQADIMIDFSSPELFRETLAWCVKNKIPFLSGTTGLNSRDKKSLVKAAKKIPVLWTANTSLGIQIFKNVLRDLLIPQGFSLQLKEWHHLQKKDKPSGTAIVLQELLSKNNKKVPPPVSYRKGQIIGTHRLEISAESEKLVIEHDVSDRAVFAEGAVVAAEWLAQQKAGIYSMEDVVKQSSPQRIRNKNR